MKRYFNVLAAFQVLFCITSVCSESILALLRSDVSFSINKGRQYWANCGVAARQCLSPSIRSP